MLPTFLLTAVILIICVALLSVKILFKKGGTFPNSHVGGNKALSKKGIYCAKTQHREQMKQKNLEERMKDLTSFEKE